MQGGFDNSFDFGWLDAVLAAWTGSILFESRQTQGQKPFPPELYSRTRKFQCGCNVLIGHAA